jgi:alpha-tubulin suppressor-like RCC1 family protein
MGGSTTCVVRTGGETDCFGSNSAGQLGNGNCCTANGTPAPPTPALTNVVQLSMRERGVCALAGDGTAKCWGYDIDDRLGNSQSTYDVDNPTPVMALSGAVEIAKGWDASCARKGDGTVMCWGPGYLGEIGDGQYNTRGMATAVPGLTNVKHIVAGGSHACALLGDGSVQCWGMDAAGQLGDGVHQLDHAVGVQMTCP